MNKYIRLYQTIKYLRFKQIYFRVYYFLRNKYRVLIHFKYKNMEVPNKVLPLCLIPSIESYASYDDKKFIFLNLSHTFTERIDWNFLKYGKLWCYNLNYFEFLNQNKIEKNEALFLMLDYIEQDADLVEGKEPFPLSLRGMNWIKFITFNNIENISIDKQLYNDYQVLMDNLEYHILGNHLLENGYSLLFGAYYFKDEKLYTKAKEILLLELEEEILDDGGHYELSMMYHQLMLFRLLDCINLISNNDWHKNEIERFLRAKASLMLGWLHQITYENGTIPLLNDSSVNIAPSSSELFMYAKRLGIKSKEEKLFQSGYRKITFENYEAVIDIGNIGPDYILGHAHADTFNFEVQLKGNPFIVDMGLSTYENNERRTLERSTKSHNTVEVKKQNSSHVWGGFRVAQRAKVFNVKEDEFSFSATHDGYLKEFGLLHTRKWEFSKEKIIIVDSLNEESEAVAYIHFYPNITKEMIRSKIKIVDGGESHISTYKYAVGFNLLEDAYVLEISFKKEITVEIIIEKDA